MTATARAAGSLTGASGSRFPPASAPGLEAWRSRRNLPSRIG